MRRIERVAFYALQEGDDGHGNDILGWADAPFLTVRAEVQDTPGGEVLAAGRVVAQQTALIRFRAGQVARALTEAHCAELRGVRWNIRSIRPVARGVRQMEILIEKGVSP